MVFESQHDVVVIYHKNCLDGIAAAWVAWAHYKGNVDLLPMQYGDSLEETFGPNACALIGKKVYCLDFSFSLEDTKTLMEVCQLIVLDHHETAVRNLGKIALTSIKSAADAGINFLESVQPPPNTIIVDRNYSGAMLSWMWFHGHAEAPYGIQCVQDRDLWKWQVDGSRQWTAAAFSHELTVENFDMLLMVPPTTTIVEGTAIQRHMEKTMNVLAKSARRFQLDEYDVPIVNCNALFASDLGAKLAQEEAFSVTYNDSQNGRQFSLRTSRKDVKVNEIAERFGGGGHPGAAGFRIPFDDDRFYMSHLEVMSK